MAGEKVIITAAEEVAEKLAPGATRAATEALAEGAKKLLPQAAQRVLGMEAAETAAGTLGKDAAETLAGNHLRSEFLQAGRQVGANSTVAGVDLSQLSPKAQGYLGRLTEGERHNLLSTFEGMPHEDISEMVEMVGPKLSTRNDFLPALSFSEAVGNSSVKVGEIGNAANAAEDFRRSMITGNLSEDRVAARTWINRYMPEAIKQPPLSTVLPAEAGTPAAFGEGKYAVGKLTEPLQTEHLETCAAINCVDTQAGKQILLHAGDWNTASDITKVLKNEGFNLDQSQVSIMIGPRASSTLENILPAFKDANGAIREMKVIPSPPGMYPSAVSSYKGQFYIPNKLMLGD